MPIETPELQLYMKDPATDGGENFNVKIMMNDNWEKLDARALLERAHRESTNNPHNTTAAQVGAYTKSEADTMAQDKADTARQAAVDFAKSFGLGDSSKNISGTNLNDLTLTGFYRGNNLTNSPDGTTGFFFIINQQHTTGHIGQIAMKFADSNNQGIYRRRSNGGVWSAWGEMETAAGAQAKANAVNSQQVNVLSAKLSTDGADTYPVGITEFAGTSTNGFFANSIITTFRTDSARTFQMMFERDTQRTSIRYWTLEGTWTQWFILATTDKAQMYKLTADDGVTLQFSGDMNTLTQPGRYYINSGATNRPFGGAVGMCIVDRLVTSNGYYQRFFGTTTGRQAQRYYNNGVWGEWFEVLTDATPTFTNIALLNGATVSVSGREPRYTKVGRLVTVEGEIANIAAGTTIGNLPSGFRPPTTRHFKTAMNTPTSNDGANIYVTNTGDIVVQATANTTNHIALNGISFYI